MSNLFLLSDSNVWESYTYESLSELKYEFKKRKIEVGANCTIKNGAKIGEGCTFGEGCIVGYKAIVQCNAVIEKFVVLAAESFIGSYAKIKKYSIINVGATVAPLEVVEEFTNYVNPVRVPYRHTDFQTLLMRVSKLY